MHTYRKTLKIDIETGFTRNWKEQNRQPRLDAEMKKRNCLKQVSSTGREEIMCLKLIVSPLTNTRGR